MVAGTRTAQRLQTLAREFDRPTAKVGDKLGDRSPYREVLFWYSSPVTGAYGRNRASERDPHAFRPRLWVMSKSNSKSQRYSNEVGRSSVEDVPPTYCCGRLSRNGLTGGLSLWQNGGRYT